MEFGKLTLYFSPPSLLFPIPFLFFGLALSVLVPAHYIHVSSLYVCMYSNFTLFDFLRHYLTMIPITANFVFIRK